MQFTLTINLDNAAMSDGYDVSNALDSLANTFRNHGDAVLMPDTGKIRDISGNTVGYWEIE